MAEQGCTPLTSRGSEMSAKDLAVYSSLMQVSPQKQFAMRPLRFRCGNGRCASAPTTELSHCHWRSLSAP
eukprot:SAG11_NODE_21857_length_417_cov_0.795597_1_plen_69_part_01